MRFFQIVAGLGLSAVLAIPDAVRAEDPVLRPGDRLALRVAGLPDLNRDLGVAPDGSIALPLAGPVPVAGQAIGPVAVAVAQVLSTKVYRHRTAEGRVTQFAIDPLDVTVEVLAYSDVYVSGLVEAPGRYAYVPGLTARRVVALAGGLHRDRPGVPDPLLLQTQLAGTEAALIAQLDALSLDIRRLQAELAETEPMPGQGGDLANLQAQRLTDTRAALTREEDHLRTSRGLVEEEIARLTQRLGVDTAGMEADQADYDKVLAMVARGLADTERLTDVRRLVQLSSSRRLETASRLADSERLLARMDHDLGALRGTARAQAQADLATAYADRAELRARLTSVRSQMQVVALGTLAVAPDRASLTILRTSGEGERRIAVTPGTDTPVLPGDLIEVRQEGDAMLSQ